VERFCDRCYNNHGCHLENLDILFVFAKNIHWKSFICCSVVTMGCTKALEVNVGGQCAKNREIGVITKLINKAERRKKTTESFYVYAVLQSTIGRLKLDDFMLKAKGKKLVRIENCSSAKCVDDSSFQPRDDPLHLDSFFKQVDKEIDQS